MKLHALPLIIGLLPIGAVSSAYWIAAHHGHVPACVPFIDGCTTISSTGRAAPESLLFRATMIPTAVLLMLYWYLVAQWLEQSGDRRTTARRVIVWLGSGAAVFLIVYTVALGFISEHYAWQRRIGVTLFFAFTFLAQLLFVHRLSRLLQTQRHPVLQTAYRSKAAICLAMLALGVAVSPLKALYPDHTFIENIVEWNFALLMFLFFVATWPAWRATAFSADFSVRFPDD